MVSSILRLKQLQTLLFNTALKRKTDAVLLVDYPDFNLRIAKKFKKAGIPVYYYISPTVWAWRYKRVNTIKKYVDHLFIIFPFEIPIYHKEKIPFTYTGHPLLPSIKMTESKAAFRKKWRVPDDDLMIAVLPGSRKSEVNFLLPRMLKAMEALSKEYSFSLFLLKAHNIENQLIAQYLKESPLQIQVIQQQEGYNLIGSSDVVLTTCGTSNLEIAVLDVPFTAVYRVNKLSYFLGKRFVKINLYSIVNILAGKEVIRELIQHKFTVENIVREIRRILNDNVVREEMRAHFDTIRKELAQNENPSQIIYKKIKKDLNL